MIGTLRGELVARSATGEVIVEVGGVGYRVSVTPVTAADLVGAPGPAFLHVHTHVREDAIVLYGFRHDDERRCFEALIGAHGVGPSLALSILSVLSPAALSTAVLEEDLQSLCAVPGVGRKTAARLLIDLKSRLELPDLSGTAPAAGLGTDARTARGEARAALVELGYGPDEIKRAFDGLSDSLEELDVEAILRLALRDLAGR